MRITRVMPFVSLCALSLSGLVAPREARACMGCDAALHCIAATQGGQFCLQTSITCTMLFTCVDGGGPMREPDLLRVEDLTTFTLFDAPPGGLNVAPLRRAGALPLSLGEAMRSSAGPAAGSIAEAGVAHGRDFAGVLGNESGDGFALRRTVEPSGVRLEVRRVSGGLVGAVIASEVLGEGDQLTVPVQVEGRDRVLVLQTRSLPAAVARFELPRLRQSLVAIGRVNASRTTPLLQLRGF